MSRTKLKIPDTFKYSAKLKIRITDINYGGHLGNDAVLSLIHEARLRFLNEYKYSETDIEGAGILMTDSIVVYKSEGFYGDEVEIKITVENLSNIGCDFYYLLLNVQTGKEIARAKTGIVFFDYKNKNILRTPDKFIKLFKNQNN